MSWKERLFNEPALIAGAVAAVVNMLVVLGVPWFAELTGDQLAAINTAMAAVLAVFVRQSAYGPNSVSGH